MTKSARGMRAQLLLASALLSGALAPSNGRCEGPTATTRAELAPGVEVIMKTAPFDPAQHDTSSCGDPQKACLIDGVRAFGTMSDLPSTEVTELVLLLDGKEVELESRAMYNPSSPREDREIHAWLSKEQNSRLTLRAEFSDGAAAYRVEWEVTTQGSLRTIITCYECLDLSLRAFTSPDSEQ